MVTLKDRNRQIPNGLKFLVAETNWSSETAVGKYVSLRAIANGLIQHRLGNPHLTQKYNWSTDLRAVENEVAAYNAQLCAAHGYTDFITDGALAQPPPPSQPQSAGARFAGSIKRTSSGIKLVADWLGEGLIPVSQELAEKRARACAHRLNEKGEMVACPKNQLGNFWQRLEGRLAQDLKTLIAIKNDMELKTPYDDKLHSCMACDCKLDVKIWPNLELTLKNTSPEVMANLDPQCWILKRDQ